MERTASQTIGLRMFVLSPARFARFMRRAVTTMMTAQMSILMVPTALAMLCHVSLMSPTS